jgi:hypothetical protein
MVAAPAWSASAAHIPAGTEISVRLMEKVGSEATVTQRLRAVALAPVVIDGDVVLPAGPEPTGTIKDIKEAADGQRAQMRFDFTQMARARIACR